MAKRESPSKQSGENLDDILKCNICLETLKEPKLFPCLHTFCKSCIHTYIESFKEKKDETVLIACPVCRQPVPSINSSSDDVETLVETLPENHFAQSLLNKSSLSKSEKFCDPCKFDGMDVTAISWCGICDEALCTQCEKCHRKFKATSDHELIPVNEIGENGANISKVIFCDDHRKSVVQVYCVDHKKACCTLCATLSHRKCEKVISIQEAASGIKQSSDVSDLLQKMDENVKLLTDGINFRDENEVNINTEATNLETTVTKTIKQMKDHLDRIQNKILCELEAAKKQTSMTVTDDINDFTSYKNALTNWKNMLTGVVKHGSDQQCLVVVNEIAPKIEKLQNEIKHTLENMLNVSLQFQISTDVKNFECIIQSLGDLQVKGSKIKEENGKLRLVKTDFRNGNIKVIRKINVATYGLTSGIFWNGLIISTAFQTKKVLKYNTNGDKIGELSVQNKPYDLCHLSGSHVVASSYDPSLLLYFIDCAEMTLLKTLNLANIPKYGVCGICVNANNFIVGSEKHLTWIDQSYGRIVKSVTTLSESYFVSTSGNNDYIYGDGENSVSYVVNDTKQFTYTNKELIGPRGIGIDSGGNFYIPGYSSKNIHQITDKGELIRIIPVSSLGIQIAPWLLRFEPGTNRFLVSCNSGTATLCEIE